MIFANVLMRYINMTPNNDPQKLHIEVVLAMPEKQELVALDLAAGATVADAIEQSGIAGMFGGFELDRDKVGIFGQRATMEQELRDGDRVEIYRSLIADPKEIRRQRALV
ncbi:MAG: RnfH family protein [Gammaproteobacteria bacterium]|nr:MAG: RnfH family protein [Gammaproteobacteria bacterium]